MDLFELWECLISKHRSPFFFVELFVRTGKTEKRQAKEKVLWKHIRVLQGLITEDFQVINAEGEPRIACRWEQEVSVV